MSPEIRPLWIAALQSGILINTTRTGYWIFRNPRELFLNPCPGRAWHVGLAGNQGCFLPQLELAAPASTLNLALCLALD